MTSHGTRTRPRGYMLLIALTTCFLVLAFVTVLSGLVVVEWVRDGQRELDARAEQLVASTQAWTRRATAAALSESPVALSADDLLPTGMTATVTVCGSLASDGSNMATVTVRLERGRRHRVRCAAWAVTPAAR